MRGGSLDSIFLAEGVLAGVRDVEEPDGEYVSILSSASQTNGVEGIVGIGL